MQGLLGLVQTVPHGGLGVVELLEVDLLLLLAAQLVQLGENFVGLGLGLAHDALGLGLALGAGVVLGFFHLLPEGPGLSGVLLPLTPQAIRLGLGLLQPLALLLQLGQHVLEADGVAVHLGLGVGDNALVQSQPPGDGEGVGLAGDANQQSVGGAQGLHVELTAGVFHPRRGHGEGFQLGIVGGGGDQRPLTAGAFDDGNGQGRALDGVRTGSQLVKQQQALVVHLPQDLHDVGHMGGEGGQALFDALLVAYVCQHPVEHPDGAAAVGGDVQAALGHQAQQADGFQGHGLAAGVGAGDHQGVELLAQLHGDGHGPGLVQQGVPGTAQCHAAPAADLRTAGVELIAQLCPGEDHVQVHQNVIVPEDVLHLGSAGGGQLAQDAVDLLLLPGLQLLQLVVGLHHAHGLHKQRGPGGGDVVDQAGHTALALGLHRHHEPAVPLGDQGLLQHLGIGRRGDDLLQNLPSLAGSDPHFPPDIRQLGAGGVGDGLLVQNGGADLLL